MLLEGPFAEKQVPVEDFHGGRNPSATHGNDNGVHGMKLCLGKLVQNTRVSRH